MSRLIDWLTPWEFSPTVLLATLLAAALFIRGARRCAARGTPLSPWRSVGFFAGLILTYLVLQSRFDYLSQHMFWIHRLQHLVLHHLGPFLMVLSVRPDLVREALPGWFHRRVVEPALGNRLLHGGYRFIQHPLIASLLFVGLIAFWLTPSIHFAAMLSEPRYLAMNWSMLIDGVLFWWAMLDPRKPAPGQTAGYGARAIMLWAVMLPQIVIGAHIGLSRESLFSVYNVCGRAWPISPLVDQQIGGLITWIPACMMSVVGALIVLRLWVHSAEARHRNLAPLAALKAS